MSRHVVGYEGVGKSRRPIYRDEGPASSAVRDPVAAVGVLSATQVRGSIAVGGGAGQVERRQLYDAQTDLRAQEAREARAAIGGPFVRPGPPTQAERDQASRQRGAERHVEVVAARKTTTEPQPPPEEEIVSEPRADHAETIPELDVVDGLDRVAEAANDARLAWSEKVSFDAAAVVATAAWERAREALDAAYRALDGHVQVVPAELVDALEEAVQELEAAPDKLTSLVDVNPGKPLKERPGYDGLTTFQRRALEAVIRYDGDRKAAAKELGVKNYQSIDNALEWAGQKGALPIALIPKLPARFAKYSGV